MLVMDVIETGGGSRVVTNDIYAHVDQVISAQMLASVEGKLLASRSSQDNGKIGMPLQVPSGTSSERYRSKVCMSTV